MDNPRNLARVAGEVAGKPGRDQEIDRLFVARRQIEQSPRGGLREDVGLRLRPERNRHLFHVVAATLQLGGQRLHVQLCAAFNKGHLSVGDDDALN